MTRVACILLGVQVRRDPLLAAFCAEMERAAKALKAESPR
jgi:hypothetical protein